MLTWDELTKRHLPNGRLALFLVLVKQRMPNLASRSLGLTLKALPEHCEAQHADRSLMTETFTDIEQFEGTYYKAPN